MKLKLKVIPGSSKDCIMGWLGDALKVKIKAPPENGKANAAVEKFMAKFLGVSRKDLTIISGFTSPNKIIEISKFEEKQLFEKVPAPVSLSK